MNDGRCLCGCHAVGSAGIGQVQYRTVYVTVHIFDLEEKNTTSYTACGGSLNKLCVYLGYKIHKESEEPLCRTVFKKRYTRMAARGVPEGLVLPPRLSTVALTVGVGQDWQDGCCVTGTK